ncbi:hypothetical protein [Streptomyces sp. V1I1]|uniref:hypothetical protein n=1 Tax=Streptomyces sp. V1I1 TaxID=3042272 RepID=UPI00278AE97F|nr:hypothetical protein [Streptomyces sp. V1I1]MDQ0940978.1 hypothetical protein [Streptomyces sp. V1I1]
MTARTVSLLRSGLLTVRAGEFVFLHQTLLEYCAARHASPHARAQELDRLLVKRWYRHWPWPPRPARRRAGMGAPVLGPAR